MHLVCGGGGGVLVLKEWPLSNACTFNEQLLSMATQQGARQEGCKVDKGLSQQGRHLLQGSFQLCCNADKTNKNRR